jgi:hypothetical protein
MEKIKVNGQEFDLIPMGISSSDKRRCFTISTLLSPSEIETAFADVSNIQYVSEEGEVLRAYLDCVSLKGYTRDIGAGTYTVELSTDAVEKRLQEITSGLTYSELALVEVYEMLLEVMG